MTSEATPAPKTMTLKETVEELKHWRNRLLELARAKRRWDSNPRPETQEIPDGSIRKFMFRGVEKLDTIIAALEASPPEATALKALQGTVRDMFNANMERNRYKPTVRRIKAETYQEVLAEIDSASKKAEEETTK